MELDYAFCFNAMPIDEYVEFCLGELPYRSLRFHHRAEAGRPQQAWSITNFTDSGPITRETTWHIMPHHVTHNTGRHSLTHEEPCDYRDNNMERYYPVKTADGRYNQLYDEYRQLAGPNVHKVAFIGRCGTCQYLDMDQVNDQSLMHVENGSSLASECGSAELAIWRRGGYVWRPQHTRVGPDHIKGAPKELVLRTQNPDSLHQCFISLTRGATSVPGNPVKDLR